MLPFLGLGAAMGIEDGVILGRAFAAGGDGSAILGRYEATRRDRANSVMLDARREGELFQAIDPSTFASGARPSATPGLYTYDPAAAPLCP